MAFHKYLNSLYVCGCVQVQAHLLYACQIRETIKCAHLSQFASDKLYVAQFFGIYFSYQSTLRLSVVVGGKNFNKLAFRVVHNLGKAKNFCCRDFSQINLENTRVSNYVHKIVCLLFVNICAELLQSFVSNQATKIV